MWLPIIKPQEDSQYIIEDGDSPYRDMFYFVIGFLSKDEEKMSKLKYYLETNFNFKLGGGNVDSE